MARKLKKINFDASNEKILNAIRNDASQAYADAVPVATGDNAREVGQLIMNNDDYRNEFVMSLINRIGKTIIASKSFNNPLNKYKMGVLEMGEVVQEIFVNSVEEKFYSMFEAEKNVFKVAIPDVRACYYPINSRKLYKATINESMLAEAFLSRNGIADLVSKIMDRMKLQDEDYEFKVMQNCIKQSASQGQLYPISLTEDPTTETGAKELVRKARAMFSKMKYPSQLYNFVGVKTLSEINDIMLIIDSDMEALLDVEVLAKAFNMEKAEFLGHLTVIPKMPVENCFAIMCDKNWWKTWDNKLTTQSIYNTEGLYYNITFHHWATYHWSPFENAIIFTTDTPSITSLTFNQPSVSGKVDTTIELATTIQTTGQASKSVIFEITSGNEYVAEFTSDGINCQVKIRPDAKVGEHINITATSTYNDQVSDVCDITIIE